MKKTLRKIHLILGLTSGIVVLIVALSGCIIAFDEEIRELIHNDLYTSIHKGKVKKIEDLILEAKKQELSELRLIRVKSELDYNYEFVFKNGVSVFMNQNSGQYIGKYNKDEDLFSKAEELHKSLFLDEFGETIIKINVLVFFIMIVSGIIIWWPNKKNQFKDKLKLTLKSPRFKLIYDLHNVLGFYAFWLIIITVLTGMIWKYEWAENSLYSLTNSRKAKKEKFESKVLKNHDFQMDNIVDELKHSKKFKEVYLFLPENEKDVIKVSKKYKSNGIYRKQDIDFYDQYSGKKIAFKNFEDQSLGDKIRMSAMNLHIGKSFGLLGRILVFFASLICASLPITGFLIWKLKRI